MIDQSGWLYRLGANRPAGAAFLTPEILTRTGPPPLPVAAHDDDATRFIAFRVIPLLADDNCRRAALKVRRLRESAACQADLDEAAAEASFWAHVRDWAAAWGKAGRSQDPARGPFAVRLPRQRPRGDG